MSGRFLLGRADFGQLERTAEIRPGAARVDERAHADARVDVGARCFVDGCPGRPPEGVRGDRAEQGRSSGPFQNSSAVYHSIRPTRIECVRLPTSLKLPRVPVKRPNVARVETLKTRLGSEKLMCLYGLFRSQRIWNRTRSRSAQVFDNDVCAQMIPGE